ncbi:hypothetical protein LTR64_001500 [Lithohypha guttulata]|uniref:uncharacterized protein n=1 Tax=Lithohypha guttulata TaxID=1690604 RepID=UPI002DDDF9BA|nr:hypothetical protein LTR51_003694 [Lithohypha guttulata]
MQLPDHLFRTYRTYKIEEQNFLRWIYETASLYGHKFEPRRPVEQVPNTEKVVCHDQAYSKLKGRARTLARKQLRHLLNPTLAQPPMKRSQTQIPDLVLNQVQKILDLRRSCVDWFRNNTPQNDHRTRCHNDNHEYLVRILEQAFTVLSAANRTSKTAPDSMKQLSIDSKTTKVNLMFNGSRYAALEQMGDSSDATDYLKDNRKNIDLDGNDEPLASKKTDPRIQQPSTPRLDEDLKLQEEYNFARFCFYKDVQQIEDFLFLEIVRYALDAANSNVLPFLTDVAI